MFTYQSIGATGTVIGQACFDYVHSGGLHRIPLINATATTIDTTVSGNIDVTAQRGTANANNSITITNSTIEIR
jgi:hypothetical protein